MRVDLSDLVGKRGKIKKMIEAKQVEVAAKVTLDAHRNIVMASPVDSGAFRAAWEVETPKKPYENGTVTNATEYAIPLAHGHSPQAPAGWIENACTAAVKGG
ncbi:hypothetical protein [Sphingomonas sp. Leaf242]|uniref:hypothetical protein n=1 Tax=Sphingomonas sp. Leaf242 TaxID=1736304 RepID=UPI000714764D|nr:hypothetical protein [Sphingomonas sp. Leaf242]KQO09436.1 hypothetical protein ASF09_07370 [Sphingomonas sp. Leaf242]